MERYVIPIEGNLTSFVFYNTLLKKLHDYFAKDGKTPVLFDFSGVRSIESLVIPNLLCVGYIIAENTKHIPYMHISDNITSGSLKRYLNEIKFVDIAEKFGLFEFSDAIKGGWAEKGMDKLNTTIFFDSREDEQTSWGKISNSTNRFANKYLGSFNVADIGEEKISVHNFIIDVCKEMIENSKERGKSFAFMTIQYNYHIGKAYISISDCGMGFKSSINAQIQKSIDNFSDNKFCTTTKMTDEIEGIVKGIYTRAQSKVYGLYNVITQTLARDGVIRIHSMDTQIVLTSRLLINMEVAKDKSTLNELIKLNDFSKNIRRNLKYGGVHIEIEIPIEKSEIKGWDGNVLNYKR